MRILFGTIVTDARGRLGGQVFRKNATGSSITSLALPRGRFSANNKFTLQILTAIMQRYGTLTALERQRWRLFAQENPQPNRFGQMVNIGARGMFVKCVSNRSYNNILVPASTELTNTIYGATYSDVELSVDTGVILFNVSNYTDAHNVKVKVCVTSASVDIAQKNKFRRVENLLITSNGQRGITLPPDFNTASIQVGRSVWVEFTPLSLSGYSTASFYVKGLIVPD